jgi:hypothetical protein
MDADWCCWGCNHRKIGGHRFPCHCQYPASNNPERDKPIPVAIVDIGCKFFEPLEAK